MTLVLIALLPAFGLITYNTVEDHRRAAVESERTALQLVRLAAENHESMIDDVHELITLLSRSSQTLLDPGACKKMLADFSVAYPSFSAVLVLNPQGTVTCSAQPGFTGVSYADRPWFREALGGQKFVASDYLIGRVTSKPSVAFAAPLLDDAGTLRAVIAVAAQLGWVNRLSEQAKLPPDWTFTIFDGNGTILVRQPKATEWIGKRYPDAHLVQTLLAAQGEGTTETAGVDGVDRLYAFKSLGQRRGALSWRVAVGIPKNAAYSGIRGTLTQNLIIMAAVAGLVLATAWFGSTTLVLRPVRALIDVSAKLGKGDLSARTGMQHRRDEIGRLAGAFDQMAESIQSRERARRQTEEKRAQLANIVASSNHAIISRTLDGVVTSWNRGAEALFGYSAEEMIGRSILILVPENEIDAVQEGFARLARGEPIDTYETVRLKKGGLPAQVSVTVSPILEESGAVIGASLIVRDISGRKRAEAELRALHDINLAISSTLDREAILQVLLEKIAVLLPCAASHIHLIDEATGRLDAVACRNLNEEQWKSGEIGPDPILFQKILRSRQPLVIRNLQASEPTRRREFYRREGLVSYLGMPLIVKDQAIGVLSLLTQEEHEFTDSEITCAATVAKQASIAIHHSQIYEESKKLSNELAFSEAQIRALASGLLHARDEEARRIAHVLHSESGQFLALVYISLDELAKELSEPARARIQQIKGLLDEVENRLRDLSHELHPSMLDHLGLLPSLENLAHQIGKRSGVEIMIDGQLRERLSPLLELTIYRVLQEAFNNVVRHSRARTVYVRLLETHDLIQCAVQDDGVGFYPGARQSKPQGLGIPGMRERVEAIGGTFQILSGPSEGTKLFLSIPRERNHGLSGSAG